MRAAMRYQHKLGVPRRIAGAGRSACRGVGCPPPSFSTRIEQSSPTGCEAAHILVSLNQGELHDRRAGRLSLRAGGGLGAAAGRLDATATSPASRPTPQDRVYVFNRSEHPVIVYDRDGHFLELLGRGRVHAPARHHDRRTTIVYLADDSDHTVRKFTLDGKLLQTLGNENQPSDTGYVDQLRRDSPDDDRARRRRRSTGRRASRWRRGGDLYVSDGYGNARVHRFSAAGELIESWGEPGTSRASSTCRTASGSHTDGRVFVCDRENDRIQIFDARGRLPRRWTNVTRPGDLYIDADEQRLRRRDVYWMKGHMSLAGRALDGGPRRRR